MEFIKTLSINGAKKELGTNNLQVQETPKAKSLVLKDDNQDVVGFVTKQVAYNKISDPVMSLCEEDGARFWILHQRGEGGEFKDVATL